jgi:hypothetical protein
MSDDDVEMIFDPKTTICKGCGKEYDSSKFTLRSQTESELLKLRERAKNRRRLNEDIKKRNDRKIDIYEVFKTDAEIIRSEDLHKIRASNMDGEAERQCDCYAILKAKVHMRVLVEVDDFRPSLDDYRKFKMPDEKVLAQLMRTGEVFIPWESEQGKELLKLIQDSQKTDTTGPDKSKAFKAVEERIQEIRTTSSISMEYLRSLIEPPPNVDKFIADTLQGLDKIEGLRSVFKNDIKEVLADLKTDVTKTHDEEFLKFLNAVQRLAQMNVAHQF